MNTKACFTLILTLVLLAGTALAAVTWAASGNVPLAQGGAPAVVAYQGEVRVDSAPYTGDGYFKFAVVNAAGDTTYWSNDGTSTGGNPPTTPVQLAVNDGLFSVLLGDTTLSGMTQALTADVFSQPDRYLRVWFSSDNVTFDQLSPDTRIAAVPYALQAQEAADADTVDGYEGAALEESAEIDADIAAHAAITDAHHTRYTDAEAWAAVLANDGPGSSLDSDTVDGLHASDLGGAHYQNVVIVAKSGGDYTSVQAAIDNITGAAVDNPYLVWVAPGVYSETVTMKPYVHLQGAGQEAVVITSTISSNVWPPPQATLVLTSNVSLRDLTLGNSGAGQNGIALLATEGTTRTLVANVTARALGSSTVNHAIFLIGSGTGATLQQVTALAENGDLNHGLDNYYGAMTVLHGGSFTARGGITRAIGIDNVGGATLDAADITVLAENSNWNDGMSNYNGAVAVLHGGSFTARGGVDAEGIGSGFNGARLDAEGVTVLAEDGSSSNHGLMNYSVGFATLRSGSFTARGGESTFGIASHDSGSMLDAEGVTALAENGNSENHGLYNSGGAVATLRGGSFTGRGGTINTYGIYNSDSGTMLEAEDVTALAENGSSNNFGLENAGGAAATLRGSSFTARGGTSVYGIFTHDDTTILDAAGVAALAENGSEFNFGIENYNYALATLRDGSFIGRGGNTAVGVQNTFTSTLSLENITALGENGSNTNYGLVSFGSVTTILRGGSFTGRGGAEAYGIDNQNSGPMLEAEDVSAMGTEGSEANYGLRNAEGAHARLRGGSITAQWGITSCAILNTDLETWLEVDNVSVLAENGSDFNYGVDNNNGAGASLSGGSFTARWGADSVGIRNTGITTTLQADNVTARGELGSDWNYGLSNSSGAWVRLSGGAFLASGGVDTLAIYNSDSATWLEADNVTGLSENGSYNYGLVNVDAATAELGGGSFTGRGGLEAWGILNYGVETSLAVDGVNVLAEHSSSHNYGLENGSSAQARLHNGAFTGRGGTEARGIHNNYGGTLEAESVTALGENGSSYSIGLANFSGTVLRGGAFTGQAGNNTRGIYNAASGVTLRADNVTVLGKDGGGTNYGLHNYGGATADLSQAVLEGTSNGLYLDSGTVHLGVSELDGGATNNSGVLTCYQVYDGNYAAYTCP